jgi:resolvase-like protein
LLESRVLPDARVNRSPWLDRAINWRCAMSALLVGYARCSTDQQDFTAQRDALLDLGVEAERIHVDHGLTGTNRERPGLREAPAACRAGDTLMVTKSTARRGLRPMPERSPTISLPGGSA